MNLIPDAQVFEMFPAARGERVPPADDSILYDLRIPAHAGKLEVLGDVNEPFLWFTWARPLQPIQPPVTGQHWIWVEKGPLFWIVDMRWRRDILSPRAATRAAVTHGLDIGIVQPDEDVFFYRNSGRYGRMKVRI